MAKSENQISALNKNRYNHTIGRYFKRANLLPQETDRVLLMAKIRINKFQKAIHTQQDIQALEEYLDGIFYPDKYFSKQSDEYRVRENILQAIGILAAQELGENIKDNEEKIFYSFQNADIVMGSKNSVSKSVKNFTNTNTEKISQNSFTTAGRLYKIIESNIKFLHTIKREEENLNKELGNMVENSSDYNKLTKKIKNLQNKKEEFNDNLTSFQAQFEMLIKEAFPESNYKDIIDGLKGNESKYIFRRIAYMDTKTLHKLRTMQNALVSIQNQIIFRNRAGEMMERLLQVLSGKSLNTYVGWTVQQLVNELRDEFNEKTLGSYATSRTNSVDSFSNIWNGDWISTRISVHGITIQQNKLSDANFVINEPGKDGGEINIKGTFSDTEGKVDGVFILPGTNGMDDRTFRLSEKTWKDPTNSKSISSFKPPDFNSTSLYNAIVRTTGNPYDIYPYGLTLGYSASSNFNNVNNILEKLQAYASVSVILDTIMGYAQETGYADTIVIQDRVQKKIRVYSIGLFLDKLYSSLSNTSFTWNDKQQSYGIVSAAQKMLYEMKAVAITTAPSKETEAQNKLNEIRYYTSLDECSYGRIIREKAENLKAKYTFQDFSNFY